MTLKIQYKTQSKVKTKEVLIFALPKTVSGSCSEYVNGVHSSYDTYSHPVVIYTKHSKHKFGFGYEKDLDNISVQFCRYWGIDPNDNDSQQEILSFLKKRGYKDITIIKKTIPI